jgi:hypothetical protein
MYSKNKILSNKSTYKAQIKVIRENPSASNKDLFPQQCEFIEQARKEIEELEHKLKLNKTFLKSAEKQLKEDITKVVITEHITRDDSWM